MGTQSAGLGLSGEVSTDALELLLSGCDPTTGTTLGNPLADRTRLDGSVIRAVSGFDATLSAPKSLSVWWALTGDDGLAECHDVAVAAVVACVERFGSTTRIRSNGGRLHPDTGGLTVAGFRQSTSRLDDPQLHTHLVISAKVRTDDDGRWLSLDARVLKRHQRALGGLYQSVLRAELTNRYGVAFNEIVNGQAEIAGFPAGLLEQFSKRATQVSSELQVKVAGFVQRAGRHPTRFEHAAMEREAAADTRARKAGTTTVDLPSRWREEAAAIGITPQLLAESIGDAARLAPMAPARATVAEVIEDLSVNRSAWHRMDVLRAVTDRLRPEPSMSGERWALLIDRAVDRVLGECVDLDPTSETRRRNSDGRSVWIEPVAAHATSRQILAQEEDVLAWAIEAQLDDPRPSSTLERASLDVLQADAAASVAGRDRLVVIVGPAGAGKTTMLGAAVTDLHVHGRFVFGVAATAKAASVLGHETAMPADTIAKLLHEWAQPDGPSTEWRLPTGTTVVVDEAGMLSTPDLHRLTVLASSQQWRLVLVGDHRQLQAVGRGGLFSEVCKTSRTIELEHIHRFTNDWEAAASLQLRHGQPTALDAYQSNGRIVPGTIDEHLGSIAHQWARSHAAAETVAITTATNDHVDAINHAIQHHRTTHGGLDTSVVVEIADGRAMVGDVVATRRNQRNLHTTTGDTVRNRDRWTITNIDPDGGITVAALAGTGTVVLPADYVREHVRLGYAATEYGTQSATETASITLATTATTGRGLYVAMTRGRHDNRVYVITDTHDPIEARDTLETIMNSDRADTPATVQRRQLAQHHRQPEPLQQRCQLPDCFEELRDQASNDRQTANAAIEQAATTRQRLVDSVSAAVQRFAEAITICAPFDDALDGAREVVKQAAAAQRAAQRRVDASPRRGRRSARSDLASTNRAVITAREQLDETRDVSHRPAELRATARDHVEAARTRLRNHDMYAKWQYLPERLEAAEVLLQALDTWHNWADGEPVTQEQLNLTARALRGLAESDLDQWKRELAEALPEVLEVSSVWGVPDRRTAPEVNR